MVKFSVLIPAYNAEMYLEECVHSVLNQKGYSPSWVQKNIEIIIADDGSKDNTLEICEKLSYQYSNIIHFHKENEGQFLTRQFLLEKAKGDYILFLDADDTWESEMICVIEKCLIQEPSVDMLVFGFNTWRQGVKKPYLCENKKEYIKDKKSCLFKFVNTDNYNSVCCKVIRKKIAQESHIPNGWEKIRQGEDRLFTLACLEKTECVMWIPHYLYNYRIDNVSMTRKFYPQYFKDVLFVEEEVYSLLCKYNIIDEGEICGWASSYLSKLNDFIVSSYRNLSTPKIWINQYYEHQITQITIKLVFSKGNIRQKIKAIFIKYKLYYLIYIFSKIINKE